MVSFGQGLVEIKLQAFSSDCEFKELFETIPPLIASTAFESPQNRVVDGKNSKIRVNSNWPRPKRAAWSDFASRPRLHPRPRCFAAAYRLEDKTAQPDRIIVVYITRYTRFTGESRDDTAAWLVFFVNLGIWTVNRTKSTGIPRNLWPLAFACLSRGREMRRRRTEANSR